MRVSNETIYQTVSHMEWVCRQKAFLVVPGVSMIKLYDLFPSGSRTTKGDFGVAPSLGPICQTYRRHVCRFRRFRRNKCRLVGRRVGLRGRRRSIWTRCPCRFQGRTFGRRGRRRLRRLRRTLHGPYAGPPWCVRRNRRHARIRVSRTIVCRAGPGRTTWRHRGARAQTWEGFARVSDDFLGGRRAARNSRAGRDSGGRSDRSRRCGCRAGRDRARRRRSRRCGWRGCRRSNCGRSRGGCGAGGRGGAVRRGTQDGGTTGLRRRSDHDNSIVSDVQHLVRLGRVWARNDEPGAEAIGGRTDRGRRSAVHLGAIIDVRRAVEGDVETVGVGRAAPGVVRLDRARHRRRVGDARARGQGRADDLCRVGDAR